jgi:alpha-ribazole phosphatase/probable phosphoglycerate mutase
VPTEHVRIKFFAHATTFDNESGTASGQNDALISPLGRQQINNVRKLISKEKFDAVFSSDLTRSIETAKGIFKTKKDIKVDARLREIDIGTFAGKSDKDLDSVATQHINLPYPGGESYRDVELRMSDFLKFIKGKYKGKRVAIVAHQANQFALEVLLKGKTWKQSIEEDWRKTKSWQPGWEYILK